MFAALVAPAMATSDWSKENRVYQNGSNLVPRAHVSFGQGQGTELWNNPVQESKILGLPVSRRMRALAKKKASRGKINVDSFHKGIQCAFTSTLSLNTMF